MFENIAAIDIGTHTIKLVTARTGLKDFQLKSFVFEDIDIDIENSEEALKEALNRIVSSENLHGYKIITNLPMEMAIIRNISFPFSDVQKIAEAIPFEAEENIPFKREDLILDFQPLKSQKEGEGRVLLAAAHKENLMDFIENINEGGIFPLKMGMEANGLFECYAYFNQVLEETVIQLDIGNNKSIINIIENNKLLYTRSISVGLSEIHRAVAEILHIKYPEAVRTFEHLNLDLNSFEINVDREIYKNLKINKSNLKSIFQATTEIIQDLIEQIFLTTKAFHFDYGKISFNRVMLSGGGSNITGLGILLSKELEIPVVSLPFVDGYEDIKIQTQFPIAFGSLISYINSKKNSVNFLKGEFVPDIASATRKIYYLAFTFGILSAIVGFIMFISTIVLTARANSKINEVLRTNYASYFKKKLDENKDPITEAKKLLKAKKKDFEGIDTLISEDSSILELLKEILVHWEQDDSFDLRNITINERIIRIDGSIGSARKIDQFKEKLNQTKKFDEVTVQQRYSRNDEVPFTMTIKKEVTKQTPARKRPK